MQKLQWLNIGEPILTSKETFQTVINQNRILVVTGIIGIFSLVILNIVLIIKLLPEKYEPPLGDFSSPVIINRVPGIEGPAIKLGEVTIIRSDRCVNRTVQLTTITIWTPEDSPSIPNSEQFKNPAMKGCLTTTLSLKMPEKVTPGKWYIQGIVRDDNSADVRYWNSEIFVVVP